jgi:hypothetical protein
MTPKRPASASCHISAQPSSARQPIRMRAPGRARGVPAPGIHFRAGSIGCGAYVRRGWPRFQAACEDSAHERVDAAADGAERGGCGRGLEPLRCTCTAAWDALVGSQVLATRRALLLLRIDQQAAALRPRRPSGPGADVARASPFAVRMCQGRVGAIRRWTFGGIHRGLAMRATATAASAKRQRGGGSHVSNRDGPRSMCAIAARRRRQPRRTRLRRRRQTCARTCATGQIDHAARTRCRQPARRSAGALDRGTHQRARPRAHVHDACMRDCA